MNPLLINLNGWEIPIIVIVILILFGGKKIPEFMKGIGKGINIFKKGLNDIEEDIKADPSDNKTTGDKYIYFKNPYRLRVYTWQRKKCPFGIIWKNSDGLLFI